MNEKVVVAISGGVDSSVVASLLLEQGYDVSGVTLKLWRDRRDHENPYIESTTQARKVAEQLKIPLEILDVITEFKRLVVDRFMQEYLTGFTPNPCYFCNQAIKWGMLLDKAKEMGAQYLATGHYARLLRDEKGCVRLFMAEDETKDQSYVLSGLTLDQFGYGLLPLGELTKREVREIAKKRNLVTASVSESQDLCFIQDGEYRTFLGKYSRSKSTPGKIVSADGKVLGEHQGLENFTIGQRKGIGSGFGIPQYVIRKDIARNELVIGPGEELGTNVIHAVNTNKVSPDPINANKEYQVKIRYKSIPVACRIDEMKDGGMKIALPNLVRDATPGQIAVVYDGKEVIVSGIIESTERKN